MKFEKLGPYIKQVRGISFKPDEVISEQLEGYVPIIKSNNIKEDGFDNSDLIYINKNKVRSEQL